MASLQERFETKYIPEPNSGCWLWTGGATSAGYGIIYTGNSGELPKSTTAHRIAYLLFKGPIPDGLEIDHLCRVRSCVNPDHLEAVSHRVNLFRGKSISSIHSRLTHCPKGHPYSDDNLYVHNKTGWRQCRICRSHHSRNRKSRRK